MARIQFVLPCAGGNPIGGFKVVYEHANQLVSLGHKVKLIHVASCCWNSSIHLWRENLISYVYRLLTDTFRPSWWFNLNPQITVLWVPSPHERFIPDADIVVATAWQTAEWVRNYSSKKGRKIYFLQDYEYYMTGAKDTRERIAKTFLSGMRILCSQPAMIEIVANYGVHDVVYIPNGIDFQIFHLRRPIDDFYRNGIGFPSRSPEFKGTVDAIQALALVKKLLIKEVRIWAFGVKRPQYMPDWVEFYQRPSDAALCELYNKTAIFLVASHYEGWGLPGAEAMACGSALISTDNGGVKTYAEHGKTALLCPPKSPTAMAQTILKLLRDPTLRISLAQQGNESIQRFSWDRSTPIFNEVIRQELIKGNK